MPDFVGGLVCFTVFVNLIICAPMAFGLAARKDAGFTGFMLGLFFGPLGIIAATLLDDRQRCPHCGDPVNRDFATCPSCRGAVHWVEGRPYNAAGAEDRELELAVAAENQRAQDLKAAQKSQAFEAAIAKFFRGGAR